MNFFLLRSTKDDILKNVGNQTVVDIAIDFYSIYFFHTMEVNGYQQLLSTVFKIVFP